MSDPSDAVQEELRRQCSELAENIYDLCSHYSSGVAAASLCFCFSTLCISSGFNENEAADIISASIKFIKKAAG